MNAKNRNVVKFPLWHLLLLLCSLQNIYAQSYIADVRKLSVEDGLSSRFVNTICKDSRGFIWIGTKYGLNRYDGYEFKLYTAENSALTSNSIKEMYEDKDQKLWIIHNDLLDDINILALQTGHIQSFEQAFRGIAPFTVKDIQDIYSNAESTIWISTKKGMLYRYHNDRFEPVFAAPAKELLIVNVNSKLVSILADRKELLIINMQGHIIKKVQYQEADAIKNTFWLFQFQQKNLLHFKGNEKRFQEFDLQLLRLPEAIYERNNGRRVFMNTNNDLIWCYQKDIADRFFVFHPREGIIFDLHPEIAPLLTYGNLRVTDLYFDSENQAWAATEDGIFIISLKKNKFTTLLSNESEKYSIRAITEDDQGYIYISFYDGNAIIHPKKGVIKKENGNVWLGTAKDKQGNLWFSGQEKEIEKYNPLSGQSQYYTYPVASISLPLGNNGPLFVIKQEKYGQAHKKDYIPSIRKQACAKNLPATMLFLSSGRVVFIIFLKMKKGYGSPPLQGYIYSSPGKVLPPAGVKRKNHPIVSHTITCCISTAIQ